MHWKTIEDLGAHIRGHINLVRKLWNIDLESALHLAENLLVSFTGDK
jgi:hypothetical protein